MDFNVSQSTTTTSDMRQAAHPQCLWLCLRMKTCRYINHNSATGQCELGLGQCESLQLAAGVLINTFGPPRHGCIRWCARCETGTVQGTHGYAARITSDGAVLIGTIYNSSSAVFWANKEGVSIGPVYEADQDIELLLKDATCPLPWMPYTAGEPLPSGAVAGGRLTDGSAMYVAKIISGKGHVVFGYYNPKPALAYYESNGIHTTTSMDILVLL